jgi:hypothetical protein
VAVTAFWFGEALLGQFSSTSARRVDWDADTIKVSLHTSTYTPNQDTHNFYDDLTNEVANGNGYTTGGQAITTSAPTYDTASNTVRLDATDPSWTSASFTARYAVIYKDTGVAGTSPLLGYVDFGGNETVTSGTITIQWDSTDGVLRVVAS